MARIPKNYRGNKPTGRKIGSILPNILGKLNKRYEEKGDLILKAWSEIVGERIAPMTQAVSFEEGNLKVKVKNSTLLSLLSEHEKKRLLILLRKKFPTITIRNIFFQLG